MQLKQATDDAIRAITLLAMRGGCLSCNEIASSLDISPGYLISTFKHLRAAGLIHTLSGSNGGACLNKLPGEITLLDIVTATEQTIKINRCLEPGHYCPHNAAAPCPVHRHYQVVQAIIEDYLRGVTIESLLSQPPETGLLDTPQTRRTAMIY